MEKSNGQILYEQWIEFFLINGEPTPWENISEDSREMWESIATNFLYEYNSKFDPPET